MNEDEEKRLFREAVSGARRLRSAVPPPQKKKPRARATFTRRDEAAVLRESLELAPGDLFAQAGDELVFRRASVSEGVLRKLRQGGFRSEAELDLHGFTVAQAKAELREFLEHMVREHCRCVRIIHGKGLRSGHRGPVLKHTVNALLQRTDAVLAYASARPVDGGTGALYVLLRH
jgi:DNA-nicking Smr family endonuclease